MITLTQQVEQLMRCTEAGALFLELGGVQGSDTVKMPIQLLRLEAFKVRVGKCEVSHVLGKTTDLDSETWGLNMIFTVSWTWVKILDLFES